MRSLAVLLTMVVLMAQDSSKPSDWRGWISRGVEEFRQARYSDAIPAFQKASDLNPASPVPHIYLGVTSYQGYIPSAESDDNTVHAQRAAAEFRRALELDPKNWSALVLLGQLSCGEGKLDEAREWFRKAQALDPQSADIWYTLGMIAWKLSLEGAFERGHGVAEAIADFENAVALDPEHEDAMSSLSLLLHDRARTRKSEEQRREDISAAGQWRKRADDVRSEKVQAGIARTAAKWGPQASDPDPLPWQWAWMALHFPPPPPPPPPAPGNVVDGQAANGIAASAVVSWERQSPEAPAPIRVASAVQQQKVITKVNPAYPASAAEASVQYTLRIGKWNAG